MDSNRNDNDCIRSRLNTWPRNLTEDGFRTPENHVRPVQLVQPIRYSNSARMVPISRRNICGKLSYIDLITEAITSSSDQSLNHLQIYTWFLENVEAIRTIKEKCERWKNNIRYYLSSHKKFKRILIPDKGLVWTLDPNAKETKIPKRRRCMSDSCKSGRHLKKSRTAQSLDDQFHIPDRHRTYSNETNSVGLTPIPSEENFNTSKMDYEYSDSDSRIRTDSTGSSCEPEHINETLSGYFQHSLTMQSLPTNDQSRY